MGRSEDGSVPDGGRQAERHQMMMAAAGAPAAERVRGMARCPSSRGEWGPQPGSGGPVRRTDFRVSTSRYLEKMFSVSLGDGSSDPAEQAARQYPGVVEQQREEQQQQPDRLVPAGGPGPHLLVAPECRLYPPTPPVYLDEPVRVGRGRPGGDVGGKRVVCRLAFALGAAGGRLPGVVAVLGRPYYQSESL